MQPLALAVASGCMSHRKRLRWRLKHAAFPRFSASLWPVWLPRLDKVLAVCPDIEKHCDMPVDKSQIGKMLYAAEVCCLQ